MSELRPIAEALVTEWANGRHVKPEVRLIDAVETHLTARKNREVKAVERQIFTLAAAILENQQSE